MNYVSEQKKKVIRMTPLNSEEVALSQLGLYKVEFRILEIRISGETNLKKHFLSGNWIRKVIGFES